jgi:hypothetical protein
MSVLLERSRIQKNALHVSLIYVCSATFPRTPFGHNSGHNSGHVVHQFTSVRIQITRDILPMEKPHALERVA